MLGFLRLVSTIILLTFIVVCIYYIVYAIAYIGKAI